MSTDDAPTVRVLIVDDQDLVRAGFRVILETEPGIEVVGDAADGVRAITLAEKLRPDVVLMDVQMPGMDGLEATRRIVATATDGRPAVLILTTFDRDDYLFAALQAGASGFLLKNASPEDLIDAIHVLARGDALLAPAVTRRVIAAFAPPERRATTSGDAPVAAVAHQEAHRRLAELTDREREVLGLLATGASNSEIAAHLVLGEATVKTHVSRILMKLGLRDRIQAVVFAYRHGLVPDAPGYAPDDVGRTGLR